MQADVDPTDQSRCSDRRFIEWLPLALDGMCSRASVSSVATLRPCFVRPPLDACGRGPTSLTTPPALRETSGSAGTTAHPRRPENGKGRPDAELDQATRQVATA